MFIAECETVEVFNPAAANKATLMKSCGIFPGQNMLKALRNEDEERIMSAAHKLSSKYRKQRQEIRSKRKSKADKLSYQAGAFGTSSKPEADGNGKGKGKEKKKQPRKQAKTVSLPAEPATSEIEIMFVPQNWSLFLPLGKDQKCLIELVCSSVLWEKTLEPSMWTSWTAFIQLYYVWCLLWEHLLFKDSEAWPVSHPLENFALEGAKRRLVCPVQPKELLLVSTILVIAAHFASSALKRFYLDLVDHYMQSY